MELVEEVDAVQLDDIKAKVLEFATVNGPVMYIGIPPLEEDVAVNMDRCTRKAPLFLSEKLFSITIFA